MPAPVGIPHLSDLAFEHVGQVAASGRVRFGTERAACMDLAHDHGGGPVAVRVSRSSQGGEDLLTVLLGGAATTDIVHLQPVGMHVVELPEPGRQEGPAGEIILGEAGALLDATQFKERWNKRWEARDGRPLRDSLDGDDLLRLPCPRGGQVRFVEHTCLTAEGTAVGTVLAQVESPLPGSVWADTRVGWPGAAVDWDEWQEAHTAFSQAPYGSDGSARLADWPAVAHLHRFPGQLLGRIGTPSGRVAAGEAMRNRDGNPQPHEILPLRLPFGRWPIHLVDINDFHPNDLLLRFGDTIPVCWVAMPDLPVDTASVGFGDATTYPDRVDEVPGGDLPHNAKGAGILVHRTGSDGGFACAIGLDRLGVAVAAAVGDMYDLVGATPDAPDDSPAGQYRADRIREATNLFVVQQHGPTIDALGDALLAAGITAFVEGGEFTWSDGDRTFVASVHHNGEEFPPIVSIEVDLPPPHRTRGDLDELLADPTDAPLAHDSPDARAAALSRMLNAPVSQPWCYGGTGPDREVNHRDGVVRAIHIPLTPDGLDQTAVSRAVSDLHAGVELLR